jgi:hypothetical protein
LAIPSLIVEIFLLLCKYRPAAALATGQPLLLFQGTVDREPDAGRIDGCRLDPVPLMGRDEQPVDGGELFPAAVGEGHLRLSLQQDDPLVPLLIIPESRRRNVAVGDDPFDQHSLVRNERLGAFPAGGAGSALPTGSLQSPLRCYYAGEVRSGA